MISSPNRFIEDDEQDQHSLRATGVLIGLNSGRTLGILKRLPALQAMLLLQQQRLQEQHATLHALARRLKQQELKLSQSAQCLTLEGNSADESCK